MPLIKQHRIYRIDLQNNPDILYIFDDNAKRVGMGGQAGECRHEHNAVGIATKWEPTMAPGAFFSDDRIEEQRTLVLADLRPIFARLGAGGIVVWPSDGIGTGLSEVPQRAPKMFEWLESVRAVLEKMP